MRKLYSNIGDKLCKVAMICGGFGIACAAIGILALLAGLSGEEESTMIAGLIAAVFGGICLVCSWPLYAFGQVTNDIHAMRNAPQGTFSGAAVPVPYVTPAPSAAPAAPAPHSEPAPYAAPATYGVASAYEAPASEEAPVALDDYFADEQKVSSEQTAAPEQTDERYINLFTLPKQPVREDLHTPVEVLGGKLLRDRYSSAAFAQIAFHNVSGKSIKNLTVDLYVRDAAGARISGVKGYLYEGLVAAPGDSFGQNVRILMTDNNAHSFAVNVLSAEFSDGTVWSKRGQQAMITAREMGEQTMDSLKEMGAQTAETLKKTGKAAMKYPALIINILFSAVMIFAEVISIQDLIIFPSLREGIGTALMGLATVVSLPGFGRVLFRDEYGTKQRILRWVIFGIIVAVDIAIMAVFF